MTIVELCVEDVAGVACAREYGVDRVELCDALDVGGLTPDDELIGNAIQHAPAGGLQVIVRSRPGDFIYSAEEVNTMCDKLRHLVELTEDAPITVGFVVGAITPEGKIDREAARAFRRAAGERPLTFHRAFDCLTNLDDSLETLIELGYQRVLTTGGHPSMAQVETLSRLVSRAQQRIQIIASGGVRSGNVAQILADTKAPEVHMRAPRAEGGTDPVEVERIMVALGCSREEHQAATCPS